MGREIRMVPKGWGHPKYPDDYYEPHQRGRYIPLLTGNFLAADAEWDEGFAKWQDGFVRDYGGDVEWRPRTPEDGPTYTLYSGVRPSPDDYMPNWPEGSATMFVMYENTSEGTPISPAFETPEELARWLADNNASAFGSSTATYEQWLAMCRRGWAPSMMMEVGPSGNRMRSGVEAMT